MVGMVEFAPPDEAEILGTALTASPLAADAPVRIPVHRYISAEFAELEHARLWPSPDEAELAIIQLSRMPSADAAASSPVHVAVPLDEADFGFVLNQDLSVIRTMQTGLHQPGCTRVLLSAEECRIINMNCHLERYLGLEPGGTEPVS